MTESGIIGLSCLLKYSEGICGRFCPLKLSCWCNMNNCVKMKLGGSSCTHYKPYVIHQLLLLWERGWGRRWRSVKGGEKREKRERWRSKGWLVRQEERKNFSMMKQSVLLSDWTRLPPMGGPAPWQQALSPREKQPYPSTPPYFSLPFSLSRPPSFPQLQGPVYLSLGKHK